MAFESTPEERAAAAAEARGQGNQYLDPWRFPGAAPAFTAAPYQTIYDPNTMAMLPFMQQQLQGIQLDSRGLDKFRQEALREGPSAWAKLREQQLGLEERIGMEQARKEAMSSVAGQRAQLAMRGGLTGGARERLAQAATPNLIAMAQQQRMEGQRARLGISSEDEARRVQQLGALPGMEVASLAPKFQKAQMLGGARGGDVNAQMKALESRNAYEQALAAQRNEYAMNQYNQQMQAWASNRQAEATENAGKK